MEQVNTVSSESVTTVSADNDFELKMLDCGTNYQMDPSSVACLSCFCGSGGCFCGCVGSSIG